MPFLYLYHVRIGIASCLHGMRVACFRAARTFPAKHLSFCDTLWKIFCRTLNMASHRAAGFSPGIRLPDCLRFGRYIKPIGSMAQRLCPDRCGTTALCPIRKRIHLYIRRNVSCCLLAAVRKTQKTAAYSVWKPAHASCTRHTEHRKSTRGSHCIPAAILRTYRGALPTGFMHWSQILGHHP